MFHYRYRADYARRTWKGIDEQLVKARKVVASESAVKKSRYVKLAGATKSVNEELAARKHAEVVAAIKAQREVLGGGH